MTSKSKDSDNSETLEPGAEAQWHDGLVDSLPEERIRRRAYDIYLERGCEHGRDLEDWLQAERDLKTNESKAEETI